MREIFNIVLYSLLGIYFLLTVILIIKKKNLKVFNIVFISVFLVYAVIRLILIPFRIKDYPSLSEYGIYISTAIMIIIIVSLSLLIDRKGHETTSKSIAFAGISIALSYALSFIKIEFLGGSVTLASALPIIIYSYVYGARKGVLIGLIFGILQFIQKATVYHPVQAVLDYPVAFAALGLSGLLKNTTLKPTAKFIIGSIIGLFSRYVSHVLSGYFIFGIYAGDYGFNSAFIYSVVYNINVLIDLSIVIIIGSVLFSSKSFTHELEKL